MGKEQRREPEEECTRFTNWSQLVSCRNGRDLGVENARLGVQHWAVCAKDPGQAAFSAAVINTMAKAAGRGRGLF